VGKYSNVEADIFSIFGSAAWVLESIKTTPANFINENSTEFIRINIITSSFGINFKSTSGVLIIDIFTTAGKGPNRASVIADKLDDFLQGKSLNTTSGGTTQFVDSTLSHDGIDKTDTTLFRSTYTIPFNYFGVF